MAKYRPIFCKIWKDPDFEDLDPVDKLIFIYLCTNELTTDSGIYPISFKTISNETAIPLETVSQRLANGSIKNIMYDKPLKHVFVVNFKNYNKGGKPALVEKGIKNDYKSSKASYLWSYFIKKYPIYEAVILTVSKPLTNGCGENSTNPKPNPKPIKRGLFTKVNKPPPGRRHFSTEINDGQVAKIIEHCQKILTYPHTGNGQRFNPFAWVQFHANKNMHPAAILETIEAISDPKTWNGIRTRAWSYATTIIKTKSGNYNERDHVAQAEKFKNIWIDPKIQEVIKNIGL